MPGIVLRNWQSQSCCSKWSQGLMHWLNIYLNISTTRFIALWNSLSLSLSLSVLRVCVCACVYESVCVSRSAAVSWNLGSVFATKWQTQWLFVAHSSVWCCSQLIKTQWPRRPQAPLMHSFLWFLSKPRRPRLECCVSASKAQHNVTRCLMDAGFVWLLNDFKKKKIPCQCQEKKLYDSFSSLQAKKTRKNFLSLLWGYIVEFI